MVQANGEIMLGAQPVAGPELSRSIGMSHLSWSFEPTSTRELSGNVLSRGVGPLRISWIRLNLGLGRWSGKRTIADICTNPEPYLTIVMPIAGSIALRASSQTVVIAKNELAIWDSTQPLAFELECAEYEQISVIVPQRVLSTRAEICATLHCAHVDESNVLSELCVQHMSTLAKFLDSQLRPYEISLSNVTTNIVNALLATLHVVPRDRNLLINEIKNYIECYISDDSLSPKTIASAFEISTRYVHKLFENDGYTIGEWILNRRLDRSEEDLRTNEPSITDIAYKWGFKDPAHYSRSFKKRFNKTPSAYRNDFRQQD